MAVWTASMATGDAEVDGVHEMIAFLVDGALAAFDRDEAAAASALTALSDVITAHFAEEEALMASIAYPWTAEHVGAHAHFMAELSQVSESVARNGPTAATRVWLSARLVGWFQHHTRSADVKLVHHARQNVAAPPVATS